MNSNTKSFMFVLLFVLVISGGMIFFAVKSKGSANKTASSQEDNGKVAGASTQDDKNLTPDYIEKLAKFMTEKGMIMYGAYWCPHCQDQKKEFGDAFKYVDYVECDAKGPNANPDECVAQGVEGYPTWIYQGKKYSGYKTLSDLASLVGFTDSTSTSTDNATSNSDITPEITPIN